MKNELFIDLPQTHFHPEGMIRGEFLWTLDRAPERLVLTLGWWTEGRGTKDSKLETELEWRNVDAAGNQRFEIQLPKTPYSFNGHLITLKWALEVRALPGDISRTVDFVMAPGDGPVRLPLIEDERARKSFPFLRRR